MFFESSAANRPKPTPRDLGVTVAELSTTRYWTWPLPVTCDNIDEGKDKFVKIKLVDSLNILNNSLKDLALAFNLEIQKGVFPHSFVKDNTLNYFGERPLFDFYKDLLSKEEYNKIKKED